MAAAADDSFSSDDTDEDETSEDSDSGTDASGESTTASNSTQASESDDKPTFRNRLKKLWWKNDDSNLTTRQRLAKMGLAAVLSYGWVSNVSYAVCISIAWYGFSKKVRSLCVPVRLDSRHLYPY